MLVQLSVLPSHVQFVVVNCGICICGAELTVLGAKSAHRVTGVASLILLADIGDQRVFRVNDNVFRFPLKFKANRKLHLCALPISVKSSTIQ